MAEYSKAQLTEMIVGKLRRNFGRDVDCLLYTSDAADE